MKKFFIFFVVFIFISCTSNQNNENNYDAANTEIENIDTAYELTDIEEKDFADGVNEEDSFPDTSENSEVNETNDSPSPHDTVADESQVKKLTITSIEPSKGMTTGNESVLIKGEGFTENSVVFFGESLATQTVFIDSTMINVYTPPHYPGLVDVKVIREDGEEAVVKGGFLYYSLIKINEVSPSSGSVAGGSPVTVKGEGFSPDSKLFFGTKEAINTQVIDYNTIIALTPSSSKMGFSSVTVSNKTGFVVNEKMFFYYREPVILLVNPAMGSVYGGEEITILGDGFTDKSEVFFDDTKAQIKGIDHFQKITVITPPHDEGYSSITIKTEYGITKLDSAFYFYGSLYSDKPYIKVILPQSGSVLGGDEIYIFGSGFTDKKDTTVLFGDKKAEVTEVLKDEGIIKVLTPSFPETKTVDVTVFNKKGKDVKENGFTFQGLLVINQIIPSSGSVNGGTEVKVMGSGFSDYCVVKFGELEAEFVKFQDSHTLIAKTPKHPSGFVDVEVICDEIGAILKNGFEFKGDYQAHFITPNMGSVAGGTFFWIVGSGFPADAKVYINDKIATHLKVESDSIITGKTPPNEVGTYDVVIKSKKGSLTLKNSFSYFDPMSMYGGTWGGKIEGSVNVTVLDANSGAPVPDAYVILWVDPDTPYQGYTDQNGKITFSGPNLYGKQMISVSKDCYATESVVEYNAKNITIFLMYNCMSMGGGMPPGVQPGIVSGRVFGYKKYIVVPAGKCKNKTPAGDLCKPCNNDSDCAPGNHCTVIPDDGKYCTTPCLSDDDCPEGYSCKGITGGLIQCVPAKGKRKVYCDATRPTIFSQKVDPGASSIVNEEGKYKIYTGLGELAIVCFGGIEDFDTGVFTPILMGVHRHVTPLSGVEVENVNVIMDIPMDGNLKIRLDNPPEGDPYPDLSAVFVYLDLGSDGVYHYNGPQYQENDVPDAYNFGNETLIIKNVPRKFTGNIYDCSYTILSGKFSTTANSTPQTLNITKGITGISDDSVLFLNKGNINKISTGINKNIYDLFGFGKNKVFAVGAGGTVIYYNGSSWNIQQNITEKNLHGVWGVQDNDQIHLFIVGAGGTVIYYNGSEFKKMEVPTTYDLFDVWGTSLQDVYAVGFYTVLHFDGNEWQQVPNMPSGYFKSIFGTSESSYFVVGNYGTIYNFDGTKWIKQDAKTSLNLNSVHGSSSGDVYAVGEKGTILHFNGEEWQKIESGTTSTFYDVFARSYDDVWIVGSHGKILRYNGDEWLELGVPKFHQVLNAVWLSDEGVGFATGNHEILITPFLEVPKIVFPKDGGNMDKLEIHYTANPGIEPHFNYVSITIPSMFGEIPAWNILTKGNVFDIYLPDFPNIEGTGGLSPGFYNLVIIRVYKEGFDIDNYSLYDLDINTWQAYSVLRTTFVK